MKYLAIDTSGDHLTVIVVNGEKEEVRFDGLCGLKHSVTLMPAVEDALNKTGTTLSELDFVACVVGAGSFTGIRIGVSTAKALAYSAGVKILGVTSFDVLAYNKPNKKTLAVIDAKHGNFYACGYDGLKVVVEPCFLTEEEVNKFGKEYEVIVSNAVSLAEGLKKAVEAKACEASLNYNSVSPLYVKKPQADEKK
ncbi:MAG: tRNA (adenosine(37)-N6)-threonylcarbamoyltransferase complex dimerization subunit type 1 TsaB [Clostridia bacterium]|nr:tRNA (adenosine(37)-N6)-threonylcarbamoyltransferase complex dimerization subunit type 1 TsaB [Clostridia bacterium]